MGITYCSPDEAQIFGSLFYPEMSGEFDYFPYRDFSNDISSSGLRPGLNFDGEGTFWEPYIGVVNWKPFIQVTGGLELLPFGASPEAKYKVGSWSTSCGNSVTTLPNGVKISIPYRTAPTFLNYELNELPLFRCFVFSTTFDLSDFIVVQDFFTGDREIRNMVFPGSLVPPYDTNRVAYGLAVNLSPGISAQMCIQYEVAFTPYPPSSEFGNRFPVYS